jgi:hypothetical protein
LCCPGYSDGVDTLTKVEISFVRKKPLKVLVREDCLKAGDIDKRLKDYIEQPWKITPKSCGQ